MPERRVMCGVLGAIVVAGALLRLLDLFAPMRYDEAFSFQFYASVPIRTGLSDYGSPTNHLLNTLAMHVSWRALGNHPWALRLPALLAGIALIPAMYAAGRALYDRSAGLIAAALAAGSVTFVQYSVDARGYVFAALFFASAIAFGARAVTAESGAGAGWARWHGAWIGFAACCVLAFYATAFMALAVLVLILWVALETLLGPPARPLRERVPLLRRAALATAAVVGASVILYAPTFGDPGWDYPYVEPLETLGQQWDLARETWGQWQRQAPLPLWPVLTVAFAAGLFLHRRVSRVRVPLVVPAAAGVIGAVVQGPFAPFPKHWIWLLPVFLLTAAGGLAAGIRWLAPRVRATEGLLAAVAAAVAFASLAGGYLAAGTERFELDLEQPGGADAMARHVERRLPGRAVLASRAHLVASYYFRRDGVPGLVRARAGVPLQAWPRDGGIRAEQSRPSTARRLGPRVLVITWDAVGERPVDVTRDARARIALGERPERVRRWRWVSLWEVRLAG